MKQVILFLAILLGVGKSYGQNSILHSAPPVIPYWAFGHWVWEDERNTEEAVKELTDSYLQHNIPVDAVIIDSPWMTQYNDFEWDTTRYPHSREMIDQLHKKGIRVLAFYTGCLNSSSYSGSKEKCKTYDFAVENNFCVNGNRESKWFKGPGVHVDMTNTTVRKWWHSQTGTLHEIQLDGAKIDFGFAWFGDSIQTSKGKLSQREFGYHYYGDAFDYHVSQNPEFVAMTYAWSGLGLMGFPSKSHVNWVGDFKGDWQGIKDQLKNIYLSADYGFSGIACEIGGYWKVPSNKEQFIRYTQLSSLCPIMINGGALGAFAHHLPWNHDLETVAVYRQYVALHNELSPYLFSTAVDAHLNNSTIIKQANIVNQSHSLGEQLFVKVICDSLKTTTVQLPDQGNWIDYWDDGKTHPGGSVITREYKLSEYPLFIKSGAILPLNLLNNDTLSSVKTTFLIYPEGKTTYIFHKPQNDGIGYDDITLTMDEATGKLSLESKIQTDAIFLIKYSSKPHSVIGADNYSYNSENKMLKIEKSGSTFKIKIKK